MRVLHFVMVFCLLLAVAGMSMAQMSSDQNQQQASPSMGTQPQSTCPSTSNTQTNTGMTNTCPSGTCPSMSSTGTCPAPADMATIQAGPVLRNNMPASADVLINGKQAIRIPASAGGLNPLQRAQIIANRLNQAFAAGYSWQNMRVSQLRGQWAVTLDNQEIATADIASAQMMGVSPEQLASQWATSTVVALGGQPQAIAMQIQPGGGPVQAVAGSQQQLGNITWCTQNTKSVQLLSSSTGNQLGFVTVAGTKNALGQTNSVVVYQKTCGQATVWTFVPIAGTALCGGLSRVPGVGLVSVPTSLVPTSGYTMGDQVVSMTNSMASQWNSTINSSLMQCGLQTNAATKIMPLYSSDAQKVVGAAQIVGNASDVQQTQSVMITSSGDLLKFTASPSQCTPMSGQSQTLQNVVISSIIMVGPASTCPPSGQAQTTTPSGQAQTTTPSTGQGTSTRTPTTPANPSTPTQPQQSQGNAPVTSEGGEGSGY